MEQSVSRILVESVVKKALKDVQDSPERSTRNLVDMALHFSEGRFQRHFFRIAHTMLENEQSPYYDIIKDTVAHVDSDRILRFSMNLGYNSCTAGAKVIRNNEALYGCNIPWTVFLRLDPQRVPIQQEKYAAIIARGQQLGIYTWMVFCKGQLQEVLPLMQQHPDSAFILYCEPSDITPSFLEGAAALNNLMLAVQYQEESLDIFSLLQDRKLLYSAYCFYSDQDVDRITSGEFLALAQQVHPVFTVLIARQDCSERAWKSVSAYVQNVRLRQRFQTFAWELESDCALVDSIISDDTCSAAFDEEGHLFAFHETWAEDACNLFQNDLLQILQRTFPKANEKG